MYQRKTVLFSFLLPSSILLTILIYWQGLEGSLLLDDTENLKIFQDYENNRLTWQELIFSNRSGTLGRPVSMITFWLDWVSHGGYPWNLKYNNLMLHLLTGMAVLSLVLLLLRDNPEFKNKQPLIAVGITACWLLSPLQVSTVLYVIQRMAQLSALLVLVGLITYTGGRLLQYTKPKTGMLLVGSCFLIFTPLAAFSKENGLLLPAFAFLIEVYFFGFSGGNGTQRFLKSIFVVVLLLPAISISLWFIIHPDLILTGYEDRDFSFTERLLTEPRVLWEYITQILFPNVKYLGLIHDDFPISHSLIAPPITILATLAWIIVAIVAIYMRTTSFRLVGFGILFFLTGQLMESSIFPLEIYFEHRNYLPSVGIYLAIFVISFKLMNYSKLARTAIATLLLLIPASYALTTSIQSRDWSDAFVLMDKAIIYHPDSPRLLAEASVAYAQSGDFPKAMALLDKLHKVSPRSSTGIVFQRLLTYCLASRELLPQEYERINGDKFEFSKLTYLSQIFTILTSFVTAGKCEHVDLEPLLPQIEKWLIGTVQSNKIFTQWYLLYHFAQWYEHFQDLDHAIEVLSFAWQIHPGRIEPGMQIFQLQLSKMDFEGAEKTLGKLNNSNAQRTFFQDKVIRSYADLLRAVRQPLLNHHSGA